jgi:hypothetical protein
MPLHTVLAKKSLLEINYLTFAICIVTASMTLFKKPILTVGEATKTFPASFQKSLSARAPVQV